MVPILNIQFASTIESVEAFRKKQVASGIAIEGLFDGADAEGILWRAIDKE